MGQHPGRVKKKEMILVKNQFSSFDELSINGKSLAF